MNRSNKKIVNEVYEWIIKHLISKTYINMLYLPSNSNEGNTLFKIVKLKEGDKLLRYKLLIDYLKFKKTISFGLFINPEMFNENDLEMHFKSFIEDLKISKFQLKEEKETTHRIEYIFKILTTTKISNRTANLRPNQGGQFASLRPLSGNERVDIRSQNLVSMPMPNVDFRSTRGTTSRSMIQSNTNNSTTSVLRRKTDRMNTIQPQTRSAQIQNTNTLQTPTTYSQASSITNTDSNQDEGRTNQRFRINNEQMPFVNQQLETNNQQSSINTNQVIMHPTGEHSESQLSRDQTATTVQQTRSQQSNLNSNLNTDLNNQFLQLLNQLQMQANQILEFNIRIKVHDRLVVNRNFSLNIEGLHIYYGDQQRTLTVLERHEPSMASMIRATGFSGIEIRKPAVVDRNVEQILKAFTCGLLIKYNNRNNTLLVYRFSQSRVFVTSHLHKDEKIQRSCESSGLLPIEALCYPKCLYNSALNYEDKTVVLKVASRKVMIEIQPLSIDKLAEQVQRMGRAQPNINLNQERVHSTFSRNSISNQSMSFNPTIR